MSWFRKSFGSFGVLGKELDSKMDTIMQGFSRNQKCQEEVEGKARRGFLWGTGCDASRIKKKFQDFFRKHLWKIANFRQFFKTFPDLLRKICEQ